MPDTILNVLRVLSHYVHVTIGQGWFYYYSQFTDEKTDLEKLHNLKRIHHEKKRVGIWVGFELRSASVKAHSSGCVHAQLHELFVNLWTVARQAPLSMGFSRQEYWSGSPCLLQGTQGSSPHLSLKSPARAGGLCTTTPWKPFAWLALRNRSFSDGLHFTFM